MSTIGAVLVGGLLFWAGMPGWLYLFLVLMALGADMSGGTA